MKPMTFSGDDRLTRLISLLYDLMRDFMPPGDIEGIVQYDEAHAGEALTLSNGYLAEYAKELAERLVPADASRVTMCHLEPRVNPDGTNDVWWMKSPWIIERYAVVPLEKYEAMQKKIAELENPSKEEE